MCRKYEKNELSSGRQKFVFIWLRVGFFALPTARKKKATPMGCFLFSGCGGGIWTSRPPGYEPDELPGCSTPRYDGAGNRGRTGTRKISRDFKSRASANSAIPAYYRSVTAITVYHTTFRLSRGQGKKIFPSPVFRSTHFALAREKEQLLSGGEACPSFLLENTWKADVVML